MPTHHNPLNMYWPPPLTICWSWISLLEGQRSDPSGVLLLRHQSPNQAEWQNGNLRVAGENACLLVSPVAAGRRSAPLEGVSKGHSSCYVLPDSQSGDLKQRNVEITLPR